MASIGCFRPRQALVCRRRRWAALAAILLLAGAWQRHRSVPAEPTAAVSTAPVAPVAPAAPADLSLKQTARGTCTLVAAALLLRRAGAGAVTADELRAVAWTKAGLRWRFTYRGHTVAHRAVSGLTAATARALLRQYPAGIILYNGTQPHAVLLTGCDRGEFWAVDPSRLAKSGEIPLSATTLTGGLTSVTALWLPLS